MATISRKLKQGDSFQAVLTISQAGAAIDLSGHAVVSAVRTAGGGLVTLLDVDTLEAASGVLRLSGETGGWPIGQLAWDVRLTAPSGASWSTPTGTITIEKAVS